MEAAKCMNEVCGVTVSSEWKKGWTMKSGGLATLCYHCGSSYENLVFCETFHSDEDGWRDCKMCMKPIHYGCIASRYLPKYMDVRGVRCIRCVKRLEMHSGQPTQVQGDIPKDTLVTNGVRDNGTRDICPVLPFLVGVAEKDEQNKGSSQQGQRKHHRNNSQASGSRPRVPKAPAEGRGSNQLNSRYLPKITNHELQEISRVLKSPVTPLFEKILTPSDTGKHGRMVLPKACAEEYFPSINQSEGIPIRILDIMGTERQFTLRFWSNNNTRMYMLEEFTPFIQTMQLQPNDIVTFSRLDLGGELVIGCRKARDLIFTYEEAQDMLSPSPDSVLTIITIEEHEFEEYKEPPVFGKRKIFTSRPSG